jgi:hypothetical protein
VSELYGWSKLIELNEREREKTCGKKQRKMKERLKAIDDSIEESEREGERESMDQESKNLHAKRYILHPKPPSCSTV